MTAPPPALPLPYPPAHAREPSFLQRREAFVSGRDSPREHLERCLERIALIEPHLRAFTHLDAEGARRAADQSAMRYRKGAPLSALDGMPVGVKDIIETRDMPTQMGSPIYADFQPRRDAASVVALKHAGALIVGKTVTTEFATGRAGPTCNPFDPQRTPGGSSSGSAAAVGAGLLAAALGTQTLASIVRPASYCGVLGWKPTHGALSLDGIQPLSGTLDHLGVLAQHMDDAWAVATVIASVTGAPGEPVPAAGAVLPEPRAPRRLALLHTAGWPEADGEARAALDATLDKLRGKGVDVIDAADKRIAALERMVIEAAEVAWRIFAWESRWPLRSYRDCGEHMVGPRLLELLECASLTTAAEHTQRLAWREDFRAAVGALSRDVDGFLSLASSGPASVGLAQTGSRLFASAWTLLGGPSFSLPLLRVAGLPLGLQLMGAPGSDAAMIGLARWLIKEI
jgi:Asp-tRNA(Asn)/Glu-tRNA(Gln) amidotransferase A subunit family amidase